MHTDFFKVLPDLDFKFDDQKISRKLENSRYDDVIMILGNEI